MLNTVFGSEKQDEPDMAPQQWQKRAQVDQQEACGNGYGMWIKYTDKNSTSEQIEDEDYLLPLKEVSIQGSLEGPLATLNIDMTYVNESQDDAIECTYEFPMDKDTVLGSLVANIDDKEIVAKVKGKEQAKEAYEDAVASGNTAVYAEQKTEEEEIIKIKLGNLLP